VDIAIDEHLLDCELPSFTLQPLVENAIKHGTSHMLEGGKIRIYSQCNPKGCEIIVEDNAGSYQQPDENHQGLGMQIVSKRLTHYFGVDGALKTQVEKDQLTRMSFIIPNQINSTTQNGAEQC